MYSLDLHVFTLLHGVAGISSPIDNLIIGVAVYLPYAFCIGLAAAAIYAWYNGKRNTAVGYALAAVSALIARGLATIIRHFYPHLRPPAALHFTALFPETSSSFPSGHAIFFFSLAFGVYQVNKRLGMFLLVLAACISIARVMAGVHWPSDILAGAVLGSLVSYVFFKLVRYDTIRL